MSLTVHEYIGKVKVASMEDFCGECPTCKASFVSSMQEVTCCECGGVFFHPFLKKRNHKIQNVVCATCISSMRACPCDDAFNGVCDLSTDFAKYRPKD